MANTAPTLAGRAASPLMLPPCIEILLDTRPVISRDGPLNTGVSQGLLDGKTNETAKVCSGLPPAPC